MSEGGPAGRPEASRWIAAAQQRFEAAWEAGNRPQIEYELEAAREALTDDECRDLFRELLTSELLLREDRPVSREYRARFPGMHNAAVIYSVFDCVISLLSRGATSRFAVRGFIGSGSIGEVYLAVDRRLGCEVALKQVRFELQEQPGNQARLVREALILGKLRHPGIISVYDLWQSEEDGRYQYAMRLVGKQRSLLEEIEVCHAEPDLFERRIKMVALLERLIAVCETMAFVGSRGVVHRDLKPEHILVEDCGETLVVDWGMAKDLGHPGDGEDGEAGCGLGDDRPPALVSLGGQIVGTLAYMSPEQARGDSQRTDHRSDVYGFGAILYHILAGRHRFAGDAPQVKGGEEAVASYLRRIEDGDYPPPRAVKPEVSAELEAVCLKAMAARPEDRYSTAKAMVDALRRAIAAGRVLVVPEPWVIELARWFRRNWVWSGPVAAALLVGVSVLLVDNNRLAQAHKDAQANLAESYLELGQTIGEQGDPGRALHWLARGLNLARQASKKELEDHIQTNLTAWRSYVADIENVECTRDLAERAVIDPQGRVVVTTGKDSRATVWDKDSRKSLPDWFSGGHDHEPLSRVPAVAFDPATATILTGGDDRTARLWDVETRAWLHTYEVGSKVSAVAFGRWNGQTVVLIGDQDGRVQVWEAARRGGPQPARLLVRDKPQVALDKVGDPTITALGLDGHRPVLVTGFKNGYAFAYDLSKTRLPEIPGDDCTPFAVLKHNDSVSAVAFAPERPYLATASWDGMARVWMVDDIQFSDTAKVANAELVLHDADTHLIAKHDGKVNDLCFDATGKTLLTGGEDKTARLWKVWRNGRTDDVVVPEEKPQPAVEPVGKLLIHPAAVKAVALHPGGKEVVTLTADRILMRRKLDDARNEWVANTHDRAVATDFSPDGRHVVVGDISGNVLFRKLEEPNDPPLSLYVKDVVNKRIAGVAFIRSSRAEFTFVTGSWDGMLRYWNVPIGKGTPEVFACVRPGNLAEADPMPPINAVAFNDGQAGASAAAVLVGTDSGAWYGKFADRPGMIVWQKLGGNRIATAIALRHDGTAAAVGGADGRVEIFDELPRQPRARPSIPKDNKAEVYAKVNALAYHPAKNQILVGSANQTATLWDLEEAGGPSKKGVLVHPGDVMAVAFHPKQPKLVLTGCEDGLARLWSLDKHQVVGPTWGDSLGLRHTGFCGGIRAVAFAPQGDKIVIAVWDRTARVYGIPTFGLENAAARWDDPEQVRSDIEGCTAMQLDVKFDEFRPLDQGNWKSPNPRLASPSAPGNSQRIRR